MHIDTFKRFILAVMAFGFLTSSPAFADSKIVVGYQQIVGPYIAAIADGRFDAEANLAEMPFTSTGTVITPPLTCNATVAW